MTEVKFALLKRETDSLLLWAVIGLAPKKIKKSKMQMDFMLFRVGTLRELDLQKYAGQFIFGCIEFKLLGADFQDIPKGNLPFNIS
ncbi:hypothetical protein D0X99_16395 [Algoriphagus lacus]|uniref:Uncharacterized protein n=1 Tax=Algoriphagus lacus TaxID=2056311 RepID=A0A418PN92_9BACT|nr:hypothetical protein D0X99_16395 [Algoriphagus lacus]